MRLDAELLDGPSAAGARVMALARLGDAEAALARVADPADAEALHDLRVALRRLRATLKALDPLLGEGVQGKARRRLAKAARATGPARDAEVLLAWLGAQRDRLQAPWRGAHDWLLEKVERERARAAARVAGKAVPRLARALPRLAGRLARPGPPPPAAPAAPAPATLAAALAPLLRARAAGLREALRSVAGPEDAAALHRARLEGKRLRYLLEPLRGVEGLGADEAVAALRRLQDLLGEWHDAHAAALAVHAALAEAAADRARWRDRGGGDADFRPGLLALARLAAAREAAAHARLEEGFLGAQATPLLDLAYAVVAALEARSAGAAPAPGRKLLLTALPAEVAGGHAEEVELGWLPGPRPAEGVGVVRGGGAERHLRLRPGRGAAGPLPRGDFEALWPLTEGRRVAKRCHRSGAAPGWRFDEFLDRRLVLAVAEAGPEAEPPAWLEPVLVRDVTAERGYADEALARRPPRRGGA